MTQWRDKAVEMFPELTAALETAETPYLLWFDLWDAFEKAYDKTPKDESLIRRIYQYSDWCSQQPRRETAADDLLTCVAVCFYEHIPCSAKAREDMPRWFQPEDLDDGPPGQPSIFDYHLSVQEQRELRRFLEREKHRYDPALWNEPVTRFTANWLSAQ